MPIFLKLRFVCETGSQCRSMGRDFKEEEIPISIMPTPEGMHESLKTLPNGWKRDVHGLLICDICARGPIQL
jgi:hypothetical protein